MFLYSLRIYQAVYSANTTLTNLIVSPLTVNPLASVEQIAGTAQWTVVSIPHDTGICKTESLKFAFGIN
jgi:hypothetical protein